MYITRLHRQRLGDEYEKQVLSVLSQWDSDVARGKESEEKLQGLFKQQQKLFQQQRIVQAQRLKTIKQLHEQYMKVRRLCVCVCGNNGSCTSAC